IMAGSGVRLAGAAPVFRRVVEQLGVPVVTAWTAIDLLPTGHPLHAGRPSTVGDRPGNLAVQNCDLLLVLGCRLPLRQISYNWQSFARQAFKIQVDVDPAELNKPTVKPDLGIVSDLKAFLEAMAAELESAAPIAHADWLAWCNERVRRYPVVLDRQRSTDTMLNPYGFTEILFDALEEGDVVVCGDGAASVVPFQAGRIKENQRLYANAGCASMGYDLPAAIGAAVATARLNGGGRTICIAGDGSLQLNLQELQTVAHNRLPIKILIYNNGGYLSIRTTQNSFFGGNLVGEGPSSGVSFPDIVRVAEAYGIPAIRIENHDCAATLRQFLAEPGPGLCEVMLNPAQGFEPRLTSRVLPDGTMVSAALEDMFP